MLAAAVGLAVLVGGCATSRDIAAPAPPPSPAPAPAPPTAEPDLRQLVITPDAIPVPGFLPPRFQPLGENAIAGVMALFDSADGERQMGTTIVLLPDAEAARSAMRGAASATSEQRPGSRSAPAEVGDAGVIITGYRLAGTASTLLLFTQGTASVAMEFRSPDTDPIPSAAVLAAGTRQAALLKSAFG
jgi:hypothetical protein